MALRVVRQGEHPPDRICYRHQVPGTICQHLGIAISIDNTAQLASGRKVQLDQVLSRESERTVAILNERIEHAYSGGSILSIADWQKGTSRPVGLLDRDLSVLGCS